MNSTIGPAATDPDDDLGARHPAGLRHAPSRSMRRGLIGLVLAALIGAAAFAAQSPYGGQWAPQLVSMSSSWLAKPGSFAQPNQPGAQLAAVETTAALPAQPAQVAPQDAAPASAPMAPELTQLLQAMARDIATVEQGVEQLKANQERMAADNARAIEQLRADQEQMRVAAKPPEKPSEQEQRPKTPMPSPRPVASATVKPPPKQPPQARAHPQPMQLQPKQQ
jgi:hypothetical protein